jgi:YegS/Rv2252/BmrU family lipid kinase
MDLQDDPETQNAERERLQAWLAQERKAVLVVNTKSRRGLRLYQEAKNELQRAGFDITAYPVRDPARLPEVVTEAIAQGCRFIIVGGGDGTVSAVAGSLAYRNVALGLLPLGTANNFARGNDIPLAIRPAVAVLAAGHVATVDLGRINESYFTNAVSIGLSSALHRSGPERMKKRFGRVGYLLAAAQRFAVHTSFRCRLAHDGRTTEVEALDLRVANGPFYGSLRAIGRADLHSGQLVVRIIKGSSKWTLGRVWAGVLMNERIDPACVETLNVREVQIDVMPQQFVSVDGEVVTQTPIRIAAVPRALHLVVPRP